MFAARITSSTGAGSAASCAGSSATEAVQWQLATETCVSEPWKASRFCSVTPRRLCALGAQASLIYKTRCSMPGRLVGRRRTTQAAIWKDPASERPRSYLLEGPDEQLRSGGRRRDRDPGCVGQHPTQPLGSPPAVPCDQVGPKDELGREARSPAARSTGRPRHVPSRRFRVVATRRWPRSCRSRTDPRRPRCTGPAALQRRAPRTCANASASNRRRHRPRLLRLRVQL